MKKNQKKIAFITDIAINGGAEKFLQDLTNSIIHKYNVTVVSYYKDKSFFSYYNTNIKYYSRSIQINSDNKILIYYRNFLSDIKEYLLKRKLNKYDIVVAANEREPIGYVLKLKCKKKIAWFHIDVGTYYKAAKVYDKYNWSLNNLKKFNYIVCVAKDAAENLINKYGNPGNVVLKHNPINIKQIQKLSQENIPINKNERTRFICVGRLAEEKGCDLLIKATKILELQGYDFELLFVGNGPKYEYLANFIKKNNLKSISLLGYKKNPYPYIKSADWLISSSTHEAYAYVVQEAAVLNIPLMLTDVSGTRELLGDNGEYGIIMEPNIKSIKHNMELALIDPSIHKHYKAKIIERSKIINFEQRLKSIEELF